MRFGYNAQTRDALDPKKCVWQEVCGTDEFVRINDNLSMPARAYVAQFNFRGPAQVSPLPLSLSLCERAIGVRSDGKHATQLMFTAETQRTSILLTSDFTPISCHPALSTARLAVTHACCLVSSLACSCSCVQAKIVGQLSGGERNRLSLAKSMKAGCNVIILDEPTNDLDVDTLRALEECLNEFDGCGILVSHDRWFLDRLCTHILAFHEVCLALHCG